MVIRFCEKRSANGHPIIFYVFHKGNKIAESVQSPCPAKSPVLTFSVFGDHAYFYKQDSQTNQIALKCGTKRGGQEFDEFSARQVRELYPRSTTPPFSEWYDKWTTMAGYCNMIEEYQVAESWDTFWVADDGEVRYVSQNKRMVVI
jgi:hypothetical protein